MHYHVCAVTLPLAMVQSLTLAILLSGADHCSKLCALFSVRWVEAGALQLGLSIPPRFVAQPRLLNRATGIFGLREREIHLLKEHWNYIRFSQAKP